MSKFKDFQLKLKQHRWTVGPVLLFVGVGFLIYSNTFNSPFVFDDTHAIVENPLIRRLDVFQIYSLSTKRFLPYLTFAINYSIHELDVTGFHIANLVIHILTTVVVWRLAFLIFQSQNLRLTKDVSGENSFLSASFHQQQQHRLQSLALFAALIFLVHPIQTQAVTYIVQRMTSLAALFYLLTLWGYAKARRLQTSKSDGKKKWLLFYIISLISGLAAVHTKENTITLPVSVFLYEICLVPSAARRRHEFLLILPYIVVALVIPMYMLAPNTTVSLGAISEASSETQSLSRYMYLLTEFRVIVKYLRLLILPINQNLDYDIPLAASFFSLRIFLSFLLLSAIGIIGIIAYWRNRLITFAVFWFYITLSVESTIIPIRDVIFEHRLYLPILAYCLLVPYLVFRLVDWIGNRASLRSGDHQIVHDC